MSRSFFCFILLFSLTMSAQERQYQRKSISSLGLVTRVGIVSADNRLIENRLRVHLHLPRFDYNDISDSALTLFRQKANQTSLSPANIAEALNATIVPQVSAVVRAVAEERALGSLKEEDLAMAAANKLKGSGLTASDVLKVLNAAYLYLPVVTRYLEETTVEGDISVSISGYVMWYRVKTFPDGSAEVALVPNSAIEQSGYASASINSTYSTRTMRLNGRDYAQLSAVNTWAKNLSIAMRRLPDFQVSAEVLSLNGATPEANVGLREGVGLDDGYYAEELFEDSQGNLRERVIGFFRVSSVADNRSNPRARSTFYPHITSGVERGVLLKEHPQFGLDVAIRPKFYRFRLSKETTPLRLGMLNNYGVSDILLPPSEELRFALRDDVTEAGGIDVSFNYNLAKQTNIRQFFATADFGIGFGNGSFSAGAPNAVSPLILNGYVGAMKKFWLRRTNFFLGGSIGVDGLLLQVGGENFQDLESLAFVSVAARLDFGAELMLSPDWLFTVGGNYKFGFPPFISELRYRNFLSSDDPIVVKIPFNARGFQSSNFSGLTISIGISYSLPTFGVSFGAINDIDY